MDQHLIGDHIKKLLSVSPLLKTKRHVTSIHAEPLGDQGFTSSVLRVSLTWSRDHLQEDNEVPKSVVVKVIGSDRLVKLIRDPSQTEKTDKHKRLFFQAHKTECSMYDLAELPDHVPMARCYGYNRGSDHQPALLVLEDLSDRGRVVGKLRQCKDMHWGRIDSLLETLTSLHAWSLNTKIDWRSSVHPFVEDVVSAAFNQSMVQRLPRSVEECPEVFRGVDVTKMEEFLKMENYYKIQDENPRLLYNLPVVLVHGDIHFVNVLYQKNPDGSTAGNRIVALLDWQLSHQGCGVEDLSRLVLLCVPPEHQFELREKIAEKYVQLFNDKVNDKTKCIELENVLKALDEMYCYKCLAFNCVVGTFAKLLNDMTEGLEEEKADAKEELENVKGTFNVAMKILKW